MIKIGNSDAVESCCGMYEEREWCLPPSKQRPGGDQLTGGQAPLIAICSGAAAVAVEWENN